MSQDPMTPEHLAICNKYLPGFKTSKRKERKTIISQAWKEIKQLYAGEKERHKELKNVSLNSMDVLHT
jgi:hypothetical protein